MENIKFENLKYPSFFIFSLLMIFKVLLCIEHDFDYSLKLRLHNGNFLILASKGIYMYNPSFTSKIDVKIFENRLMDSHHDCRPTNMVQFLSEYNGYIVCLIQNNIYLISKNGIFLTELSIDYMNQEYTYPIVPYGYSDNEYYFLIISTDEKNFIFRKYIYNSSSNTIVFSNYYNYTAETNHYKSLTCELMNYSGDKVIACFWGTWDITYCTVFEINTFNPISGLGKKITGTGGQFFKSNIMTPGRNKAALSSIHSHNLIAYIYDINTNNFTKIKTITSSGCDCEVIDIGVEYFPEREEFVYYCIGDYYEIYSARFSKDENLEKLPIEYLINTTICGTTHRVNLCYSSNLQKYFVYADSDCEQIFNFDDIEAPKIYDYPTDEIGPLICEKYIDYEQTQCFDNVPDGYYQNDTSSKIIYKCHENCETCNEGPTEINNNCLTCKDSKYLDLGNCTDSCINNFFFRY